MKIDYMYRMSEHKFFWLFRFAIAGCLLCCASIHGAGLQKPDIQFNRDIRPILSDNCFSCHGPDKDKRKAKLRVDTREGIFTAIDDRTPIVPGKPAESEIYRRITSEDPDEVMPKSNTGKKLTAQQIALLKHWIEQGAKWEGHWAYIKPTRSPVPEVKKGGWPVNEIDHFILSRLESEKLQPSAEANKRTLIRRLSFDLTGLPPEPNDVEAFVRDTSSGSYEKLVERLLASPHFGERMAIYWLDAVRYADTDGFHGDNYRSVYPFRDYIIDAFNRNMPFDQFTVEQLAGDLLPNATRVQKIASTYNRLHRTTEEGGSQAKEYLAKYLADQVRTTSTTWLGSTMACCECHDHKFDPFLTRDFYSFEAFFADIKAIGVSRPESVPLPDEMQAPRVAHFEREKTRLQKLLETPTPEIAALQDQWEKRINEQTLPQFGPWHSIGPFKGENFDGAFRQAFEPESEIDLTKSYGKNELKWKAQPSWEDGKLHNDLTGENSATYLFRTITAEHEGSLALSLGSDDGIKVWVNGAEALSKKVNRALAADQDKITVQIKPGENKLLMKIVNAAAGSGFYFKPGDGLPDKIRSIVKVPVSERSEEQKTELATYYRTIAPALDETRSQLLSLKKEQEEFLKTVPATLAVISMEPRTIRVLPRGNWMSDDGDIVAPAVPAFLGVQLPSDKRATRLDLAHWLVSKENPLTSRVFVNRLWKLFFGAGLSKTLDDLGSRGEWPTHPELLDWLACEFRDGSSSPDSTLDTRFSASAWNIKHVVKLMVMSRTYRQTSFASEKLRQRDPYNRLLARQSSFRIDAEMVRDNALAISGLLVDKIGGPSVKPYQPAGYWDQLNFPKRIYTNDHGASLYRRGLYTFWCRTFLQPSLQAFDAASREECTVERVNSNTPMQALALLNDPTYVEAARVLAEKTLREGGTGVKERIEWSFSRALARKPEPQEFKLFKELYLKQIDRYTRDTAAAEKLINVGESPVPTDLPVSEVAAWTSLSRVLLNLHETITRY
jgi:hypothetical protein